MSDSTILYAIDAGVAFVNADTIAARPAVQRGLNIPARD